MAAFLDIIRVNVHCIVHSYLNQVKKSEISKLLLVLIRNSLLRCKIQLPVDKVITVGKCSAALI